MPLGSYVLQGLGILFLILLASVLFAVVVGIISDWWEKVSNYQQGQRLILDLKEARRQRDEACARRDELQARVDALKSGVPPYR